jgi:hypothetical protein
MGDSWCEGDFATAMDVKRRGLLPTCVQAGRPVMLDVTDVTNADWWCSMQYNI